MEKRLMLIYFFETVESIFFSIVQYIIHENMTLLWSRTLIKRESNASRPMLPLCKTLPFEIHEQ